VFIITPNDVAKEAYAQRTTFDDLKVPNLNILIFNRAIIDELTRMCELTEWHWQVAQFSPYCSAQRSWIGTIDTGEVSVFIPPMGASGIAAFCEELIHFGARQIFLLCASWSLGKDYLRKGQIHMPSFALGMDGTSPHYGNKECNVEAESETIKALAATLDAMAIDWKQGGVASCEAFYRITPDMLEQYRTQGCLSMDNGEVAALYALAREHNVPLGVLLQPYIDLEQGWKKSFMDDTYNEVCRLQARAAIQAAKIVGGARQ
jgi:uridine phosphorylase